MKVYDIIDKRVTPAKKYTIAHEGGAYELAREYCGKSLYLHFPETDGDAAVVKWYGTDEAAVIVKPARVIEERDSLRELYEKAKAEEAKAWWRYMEAHHDAKEAEIACEEWRAAHYYFAGIIAAAHAVKRFDVFGVKQ